MREFEPARLVVRKLSPRRRSPEQPPSKSALHASGIAERVEHARWWHRLRNDLDSHLTGRRQPANLLAYIRPRRARREQLLDLSPSVACIRPEQLSRIRFVQVRRERAQRTQMELAASNALECLGESSTHPRRRDSPPSAAFAHRQRFCAQHRNSGSDCCPASVETIQSRELRRWIASAPLGSADWDSTLRLGYFMARPACQKRDRRARLRSM